MTNTPRHRITLVIAACVLVATGSSTWGADARTLDAARRDPPQAPAGDESGRPKIDPEEAVGGLFAEETELRLDALDRLCKLAPIDSQDIIDQLVVLLYDQDKRGRPNERVLLKTLEAIRLMGPEAIAAASPRLYDLAEGPTILHSIRDAPIEGSVMQLARRILDDESDRLLERLASGSLWTRVESLRSLQARFTPLTVAAMVAPLAIEGDDFTARLADRALRNAGPDGVLAAELAQAIRHRRSGSHIMVRRHRISPNDRLAWPLFAFSRELDERIDGGDLLPARSPDEHERLRIQFRRRLEYFRRLDQSYRDDAIAEIATWMKSDLYWGKSELFAELLKADSHDELEALLLPILIFDEPAIGAAREYLLNRNRSELDDDVRKDRDLAVRLSQTMLGPYFHRAFVGRIGQILAEYPRSRQIVSLLIETYPELLHDPAVRDAVRKLILRVPDDDILIGRYFSAMVVESVPLEESIPLLTKLGSRPKLFRELLRTDFIAPAADLEEDELRQLVRHLLGTENDDESVAWLIAFHKGETEPQRRRNAEWLFGAYGATAIPAVPLFVERLTRATDNADRIWAWRIVERILRDDAPRRAALLKSVTLLTEAAMLDSLRSIVDDQRNVLEETQRARRRWLLQALDIAPKRTDRP